MRLGWGVLVTVLLSAGPGRLEAQADFPVAARDSGAVMYEVAAGVYAIIHSPAMHDYPSGAVEWPHGNTGVIVGDAAVLVIDTDFFPTRAAADIALIRKVTDRPVKYLVNTHWHGDHTHGNGVYQKAFPDLVILGATPNQAFIALNQARFPRSVIAPQSATRRVLSAHEALLAAGADSTGRDLSEAEKTLLRRVIGELRTQLNEFAEITVTPPTTLFVDSLALDLGNRIVHFKNWGRANSPADVTAYLPVERVLFTGDIVVHPVPYVFGAYPGPWVPVLKGLEATPVSVLVPGHGPAMTNHAYTAAVRELLEVTASRVQALLEAGKTLAEVQQLIDLSDYRAKFVPAGDLSAPIYWEQSILNGLVERTFQCLTGSRC